MISICFILFLLISIVTSSYGQVTCPSGWSQQYGGSCYLIKPAFNSGNTRGSSQEGSWDQCNAYCTASHPGATMFCINNAAEHNWIWSQSGVFMWIGYTDMLPYGGGKGTKQYGWVTGCTSTYTNWNAGQPDNAFDNSDYAFLNYYGGGRWNNGTPQDQAFCGCEFNPASQGSVSVSE
jgi:hypothetical protein